MAKASDRRDMAMPGAGLVVVKAELVLGGFETVFDGPAVAFHCHQLFHGCANRTPCGEESEIAVGDVAADQQPPCPDAGECRLEIIGIEVGQFEIDPIMQSRALGPIACRQASPGIVRQGFGDVLRCPGNGQRFVP